MSHQSDIFGAGDATKVVITSRTDTWIEGSLEITKADDASVSHVTFRAPLSLYGAAFQKPPVCTKG